MENGDDRRADQADKVAVSLETVGYEEYAQELLLKLIPQDLQGNDDDLRVISVVDSEATGKTALARSVYGTTEVKRWFACRAWVHVQDNFSAEDVLANILGQISTCELKDVDKAEEIDLSERLRAYFYKQRYLLVLDNLNDIGFGAKLLRFCLDFGNGSRVIITTRNANLPNSIDPWINPIKFDPLTEEVRKKLLSPNSNGIEQEHLKRILSWCSLSPAGIRLLGGLLTETQESGKLEAMIGHLPENPSLVDIVSLCYGELSDSLQSCLKYVCQFPREYEIPTRRLLRLWLAQNLVPASERGIQDAEGCFQELVRRNMIHVVSRCKGRDFAKTCCMPGFIYDFLLQMALETCFFSCSNTSSEEPKLVAPRIVVDKHRRGSSETPEQSDRERYDVNQIRSYISFDTKKIRKQKGELDVFLNPKGERSLLEVLDLEGVYRPVLPKDLGKVLLNLKYLGLRWTILHELPGSVGDLPCLETLDVKHTNIRKVPSSIWTKTSLRHLYLNDVNLGKSISRPGRLLPSSRLPKVNNNLQTLCGVRFEANSLILDVLSKLTGITKLSLTCPSTLVKEVINRISGRTTLQSLKLKSKDLLGQPSKLHLGNIDGFPSLYNLYLFGDLGSTDLPSLPSNVKSLTLSMSVLTTNAIEDLGKLECLTDLRLYAFSFDDETLKCARGMFPQLRVLKLWKQDNLKSLIVEEEALPCLEELEIRNCQRLETIQILGCRKELKEVSLAAVKEELAKSLEASLGRPIVVTTELVASASDKEG